MATSHRHPALSRLFSRDLRGHLDRPHFIDRFQMWSLPVIACWMLIIGTRNGYSLKTRIPENPEASMNLSQIMSYWGYPNEQYDIVTKDGYILGLYRIPHGRGCLGTAPYRPVVYLQHGVSASAFNWIANLPPNSLAYILADAGCDVWLGNSRGTTWSRRHVSLSPDSEEFWAFSFDDMANYDLPATIDFIVKKTRQKQLYYLGHSQGTTIDTKFNQFLATKICNLWVFHWLCKGIFFATYGSDYRNINEVPPPALESSKKLHEEGLTFLEEVPQPHDTSKRHDLEGNFTEIYVPILTPILANSIITSGRLQAFDWEDPALNIVHYNQVTPPLYNVTLMMVPTVLWSGGEDMLADPADVDSLLPNITNLIYHKRVPYYNHMDFCLGMDAPQQVFYEVISMIMTNMQT
ncbi:lipase member K-like isoform X3 [Petaurus breviceps papuanus]|uniref:lipase member K-like isoform X3 n=1 Tax=Petaurus breviceps papuanus TaxID=3040969 RepID=UPI0036DF2A58